MGEGTSPAVGARLPGAEARVSTSLGSAALVPVQRKALPSGYLEFPHYLDVAIHAQGEAQRIFTIAVNADPWWWDH